MNRREQIIIAAAAIAALYGLFEYVGKPLFLKEPEALVNPDGASVAELTQLTGEIGLDSSREANIDYILTSLEQRWQPQSFFGQLYPADQESVAEEEDVVLPLDQFIYSGYLRMDENSIAIVNGIDYQAGEIIEGFRIENIQLDRLVLSREGKEYTIPQKDVTAADTLE